MGQFQSKTIHTGVQTTLRFAGVFTAALLAHMALRGCEPTSVRAAAGGPTSFANVIEQASPSVAHIIVRLRNERSRKSRDDAVGAGFVVSPDGLVVTSRHALRGAKQIVVTLPGHEPQLAKVVRDDERTDLALLKIPLRGLRPLPFGDSRSLRVGDWVLAGGSPYHLPRSWSVGIVSALNRKNVGMSAKSGVGFIQTDAAANLGNSGGPLIDADGRCVGVMTAILSKTSGHQGVALAAPINHVLRFIGRSTTRVQPRATKSGLGMQLRPARGGVVVASIGANSPAYAAGLRRGDVIVDIDSQSVRSATDVDRAVMLHRGSGYLQVTYRRQETHYSASVPVR